MVYSVCSSAVFSGVSLPESLRIIRQAGYDHYEFWSWWDKDLDALCHAQRELQVTPSAMCTRFIPLNDPLCREPYIAGLSESIEASQRLGCMSLITQTGQEIAGVSRREQYDSIVAGLRACVPLLKASGRTLLVEPLNTRIDHKGYYLWQSEEAFRMIDDIGETCIRVLYDVYHQHIMGEDTARVIERNAVKIGHIHIAGHPGRHEPFDENEIDLGETLKALERGGYTKAVGLEYFPVHDPVEGLVKLREQYPLG